MSVGIANVVDAFKLLYTGFLSRNFGKSLRLNERGERDLLPLVRTFLLGRFGDSLIPEAKTKLPGSPSGNGRLDFIVGKVAVEFAVRPPKAGRATLSTVVNSDEVKKLMKYEGHALLVLFDFSKTPYAEEQIEAFRNWPSLGKGPHKKSPFNVAYYYKATKNPISVGLVRKNIRVC
jgi:hypothetical protein